MAGFDIAEGVRKAFLAGVGAVVIGAEKAQELVDDLVEKGEMSVEQGRELNAELTRDAKHAAESAPDAIVRARLKMMTPEQRKEWLGRVSRIAADIEAEDAAADMVEVPQPVEAEEE